jgi:hypothetical protein
MIAAWTLIMISLGVAIASGAVWLLTRWVGKIEKGEQNNESNQTNSI